MLTYPKGKKVSKFSRLIKTVFFFALVYLSYLLFTKKSSYTFLDYTNFMIHEVGHLVFSGFGETMTILGGTLMQILMPIMVAIYFLWRIDFFAFGFCLFWLGESLINISYYIADAQLRKMSIVIGVHDWVCLLSQWGVLDKAIFLGRLVFWLGGGVIIVSLGVMFWSILKNGFYKYS